MFATFPAAGQTGTWVIDTVVGRDRPVNDGGTGLNALLNSPSGIVVDAQGNTLFSGSGNHRVRRISAAGTIPTIAGTGESGYSGHGGAAISAQLQRPQGLALGSAGNLYMAKHGNNPIRSLSFVQVAPDFTVRADTTSKTVNRGAPATISPTLASIGGFTRSVTIASAPPAGFTVQFALVSPLTLAAGQQATITASVKLPATCVAGEIIAIYGQDMGPADLALGSFDSNNSLSVTVGGTQVLFDATPAPLICSVAGQLSAIVPLLRRRQDPVRLQPA